MIPYIAVGAVHFPDNREPCAIIQPGIILKQAVVGAGAGPDIDIARAVGDRFPFPVSGSAVPDNFVGPHITGILIVDFHLIPEDVYKRQVLISAIYFYK